MGPLRRKNNFYTRPQNPISRNTSVSSDPPAPATTDATASAAGRTAGSTNAANAAGSTNTTNTTAANTANSVPKQKHSSKKRRKNNSSAVSGPNPQNQAPLDLTKLWPYFGPDCWRANWNGALPGGKQEIPRARPVEKYSGPVGKALVMAIEVYRTYRATTNTPTLGRRFGHVVVWVGVCFLLGHYGVEVHSSGVRSRRP